MPTFRAPRGTRDLLPEERAAMMRLEAVAADLTRRYGYQPIETPMFEQAAVFERGIGEVTDVVEKELFRLAPRSEEKEAWALRPEPTAGIVRAYVQHGMQTWSQPVKLTMLGPMFRYDRPQAGRFRQFWQFDVEAIGDAGPAIDAEIIELANRFYTEVGVPAVEIRLNSIGDGQCRPAYIRDLAAYYRDHAADLPALEQTRLERNPLRLLDSKDARMAILNVEAPKITDHLCDACAAHFDGVRSHLDALGVGYTLAPELVRGLDYYTRTTFEVYPAGESGQQSALGGGGRYDGLVELLGGRPTPGIGFGLGLDRVMLALSGEAGSAAESAAAPDAVVVSADPAATVDRLRVATHLRAAGLRAHADLTTRKLGRQLEAASRDGSHFAVILGAEAGGGLQLKDLKAGTQKAVAPGDVVKELERAVRTHRHGLGETAKA